MFDQKCYDLAEAFISDTANPSSELASELAQVIQTAIEEYLAEKGL